MINPLPESDLSLGTYYLGSRLLKIMKNEEKTLIVEDLLNKFLSEDPRRTFSMFFDTLTFLFMIGYINEKRYRILIKNGFTQKTLF